MKPRSTSSSSRAPSTPRQNPVPVWLEANFEGMSGRVLSLPGRKDVNLPINEQLIVELYSK